ncbi:MAG: metalloregulator ArsR/SmtB family transcription factor [Fibrobacterota bacterium]
MKPLLTHTKALADNNRLRILAALIRENELCVCQITDMLALAMPTITRHMGLLVRGGFAVSRRQGRWVHYRLSERARTGDLRLLLVWMKPLLKNDPLIRKDAVLLKRIIKDRPAPRECSPND